MRVLKRARGGKTRIRKVHLREPETQNSKSASCLANLYSLADFYNPLAKVYLITFNIYVQRLLSRAVISNRAKSDVFA